MGLVHSPVRSAGDEAHDVVFRFYGCAGVVFPRPVRRHEVLRRRGHGLEEGQPSRHSSKQAPRSCRVKVTRVVSGWLAPVRRGFFLATSWNSIFTIRESDISRNGTFNIRYFQCTLIGSNDPKYIRSKIVEPATGLIALVPLNRMTLCSIF